MTDLLVSTLLQGLIYAMVTYGVYITYSILDFPDLGVDGTFPLGAAVTAVLLTRGVNPFLTLPVSMAAGALAGLLTGFIHVHLKVRNLLAGIITMTALFSINLQLAGSSLAIGREIDTIFTAPATMALFGGLTLTGRKLAVTLVLAILAKLLLDLFFRTRAGLLLRAAGDNPTLVASLGKDVGNVKLGGLMLSNALVALGGSLACQELRSFYATMGTGQLVYGLAAVIIGISLLRFYTGLFHTCRTSSPLVRFFSSPAGTTAVLVGSILYKLCIQVVLSMGLRADLLNLATAGLFLLVLVLSGRKGEAIIHA